MVEVKAKIASGSTLDVTSTIASVEETYDDDSSVLSLAERVKRRRSRAKA